MEFGPEPVAIDSEAQKNEHRDRRPDDLEDVVAMAVIGALTFPSSVFHEIDDKNGLYRDENHQPVEYFVRLPDTEGRLFILCDPMLATGGSMIATIDLLKQKGCKQIKVIVLVAAPEGLAALQAAHDDVEVYCASIDQGQKEKGYIIPGLGDAGDKIFGTK